jgi:oxygen-dependent protoporphyrinogen oxidase
MRIAVIGGGIAGLCAAYRLGQAGIDAVVLEGGLRAGGVVGTSKVDGFVREHAANAILASGVDGVADLADELGVEMVASSAAAKRRWIWIDGALQELPASPGAFAKSALLTWRGKLALFGEPLRKARDPRLADESVHDWATRRLGPEAARALIAPFITGIYAADAREVSLAAGMKLFAELDADGGLIRGMIKKAIRGRGQPKSKKRRGLIAPRGGMQTLIDALVAQLGARIRIGTTVTAVQPDRAAGGVAIAIGDKVERYDGAVLAVSATSAARLVGRDVPALAAALGGFVRAPAAIVYLGYPAAAVPPGKEGFGFLVAQGEALRLLGCVMESALWPGRAPDGTVLLRCIFAGARDPEAYQLDDAALIGHARADLERALGVTGAPIHASVVRWAEGVAQLPVGHKERLAVVDGQARAARLVLAGAGMHGVALNDLVADARRVVDEVRAWDR